MREISRRSCLVLAAASSVTLGPPAPGNALVGVASTAARPCTLAAAVALIRESCSPSFLSAVEESGHLLYRGERATFSRGVPLTGMATDAALLQPAPDLLIAGTYDDPAAQRYFQRLEQSLSARGALVRPSIGHIGTSVLEDAIAWGQPVSVWPLGRQLHYAWPRERRDFFASAGSGRGGSADGDASDAASDLVIDDRLADALSRGRELLFATDSASAFVAVPVAASAELLRRLHEAEAAEPSRDS